MGQDWRGARSRRELTYSYPAVAAVFVEAAKTTRCTPAQTAETMHMEHGSPDAYSVAPCNAVLAICRHAFRMATTSACAVGSKSFRTRFRPAPTARSCMTTKPASGAPPASTASLAAAIACLSHFSSFFFTVVEAA